MLILGYVEMKKLVCFVLILFFVSFVSSKTPLTIFSDEQYLGNNQWKFTEYGEPKYYYNDLNQLTEINTNFVQLQNDDYNFGVSTGLYSLKAKTNGNILVELKKNNKTYGLKLKIIGFGFYNSSTKQKIIRTGITLNNPKLDGNKLVWSLPYDINYFLQYKNGSFRDVIEMPQTIKDYLWKNRPATWAIDDTWVALIYEDRKSVV